MYLFIFGCAGSLLLLRLLSRCDEQGLLSPCGVQASHCAGFSCWGTWDLGLVGSVVAAHGSVVAAHGSVVAIPWVPNTGSIVVPRLSCLMARGILPDQGSNPCLLYWQVDSFTTEPPEKPLNILNGKILAAFPLSP